jgi:hypothetical protein
MQPGIDLLTPPEAVEMVNVAPIMTIPMIANTNRFFQFMTILQINSVYLIQITSKLRPTPHSASVGAEQVNGMRSIVARP